MSPVPVQASVSVFIDDNDKLRSINAGELRISTSCGCRCIMYARRPVESRDRREFLRTPSWVATSHSNKIREYLHLQILSIVTAAQLRRIFKYRTNFDLRRLLNESL